MKKSALRLLGLLGLGLFAAACGSSSSSGGDGCASGELSCDGVCIPAITATLGGAQGIQASVFDVSCAASTCHGDAMQADLDLSSVAASEADLIDVDSSQVPSSLRVAPNSSADSYLMNKLLGQNMADETNQMPIGGTLCSVKIDAVRAWIDAGAPVN